jgi:CRISPR system Cascade subunit CasE
MDKTRNKKDVALEWLDRKAAASGFTVSHDDIVFDFPSHMRGTKRDGSKIEFNKVTVFGSLTIADHEQFCQAYLVGIGAGKAYGCGMLELMKMK